MELRVVVSLGLQLHIDPCQHVGTFILFLMSFSLLAVSPVPLRLAMGLGVGVVLAPAACLLLSSYSLLWGVPILSISLTKGLSLDSR